MLTHKFMHCKQINLGQRIVDTENLGKLYVSASRIPRHDKINLGEVIDDLVRILKSETSLLFQAPRSINSHGQFLATVLSFRKVFDILKISKCPCKQLRRM